MLTRLSQAAFIFNSAPGDTPGQNATAARPAKRRKIAKSDVPRPQDGTATEAAFPPLFNGAESPGAVKLRKELFDTAWPVLEGRIQVRMLPYLLRLDGWCLLSRGQRCSMSCETRTKAPSTRSPPSCSRLPGKTRMFLVFRLLCSSQQELGNDS